MLTSIDKNIERLDARKLYAQYYTCNDISSVLVERLEQLPTPSKIIDLSMGEGALLQSAKNIYPRATLYGCDIDSKNVNFVSKQENLNVNVFNIDSTSKALDVLIGTNSFELVLGNPPFGFIEKTPFIVNILNEFGCNCSSANVSLELLFVLLGIRCLKHDGVLSYILPDGLLTNARYENFREVLISNYRVISVVHLGKKRFEGTEACTHILTLKKRKLKSPYKVKLESIDFPNSSISISKSEFISRADYSYHTKPSHLNARKLKTLNAQLIRGRLPNKQLSNMSVDFIHTTSFGSSDFKVFSNENIENDNEKHVKDGDIVIARVGTRAIGKVGLVSKGCFHISDCIIAIRADDEKSRELILRTLKSRAGKNWLNSISKGVGARHITLTDLSELPIFI
ncbi:N-6 DNA methylase [Thalassotalea euphylliae]|uniref:N-6 DNA methylase n=1 Tax=Thalassotalea euphylliae TaxID=1655234 RepID=UPI0036357E63